MKTSPVRNARALLLPACWIGMIGSGRTTPSGQDPRQKEAIHAGITIARALLLPACWMVFAGSGRVTLSAQDPRQKISEAVDAGTIWLKDHQNPDGGYGPFGEFRLKDPPVSDLGLTAFGLYALARNPKRYVAADGPFISRAVEFVLARQCADGGFVDPRDPGLKNYKTSVVIMALTALGASKYAEPIARAREYLRQQQIDEGELYEEEKHFAYGGWGYGSGLRPDLSNTQYSLDALAAAGVSSSDELWKRSLVFVGRCLNQKEADSLLKAHGIGTTGDGGARYGPHFTRGPEESLSDGTKVFSSYGSMSYAALKAFLYAKVDKSDPRVQALFDWISKNFSVKENPGMATSANPQAGQHGLYYYYHTMSKALALYGEPVLRDGKGVEHRWAVELSEQILSLQQKDGSWVSSSDRWWESIPALDTSYAMISLVECLDELGRQAKAASAPPEPPKAAPAKAEAAAGKTGK